MTKSVSFETARGAEIIVSLITERPNLADHNFTSPCWELDVRANGKQMLFVERIDHETAGPAIRSQHIVIPIPADRLEAVDALFAEYKAKIAAEAAADIAYWSDPAVQLHYKLAADMDRADSDN